MNKAELEERVARLVVPKALDPDQKMLGINQKIWEGYLPLAQEIIEAYHIALEGAGVSCGSCKTCKFWETNDPEYRFEYSMIRKYDLGRCSKAVQLWDATEWDKDEREQIIRKPLDAEQMIFVQDGTDYRADLYTRADFFCAHYIPTAATTE